MLLLMVKMAAARSLRLAASLLQVRSCVKCLIPHRIISRSPSYKEETGMERLFNLLKALRLVAACWELLFKLSLLGFSGWTRGGEAYWPLLVPRLPDEDRGGQGFGLHGANA